MKRLVALFLATCFLSAASPLSERTEDMEVPIERQVPLLSRVLAFDRALAGSSSPLVIAVVSQENYRASAQAGAAFAEAMASRNLTVHGRAIRVVRIGASSASEVQAGFQRVGATVAYIAPLRSVGARDIARAASHENVLSLTGVRSYVEEGIAVGVGLRSGRPEILLNRQAAQDAGADFSARLLQLATLIRS